MLINIQLCGINCCIKDSYKTELGNLGVCRSNVCAIKIIYHELLHNTSWETWCLLNTWNLSTKSILIINCCIQSNNKLKVGIHLYHCDNNSRDIITVLRKQLSVCILQYLIFTANTITLAGTAYPITPALQIDFIATNDLTQVQQN